MGDRDVAEHQVVFKALLTLHQMIRSGSTDQLLDHLVKSDVMRLRGIGGQNFEGEPLPIPTWWAKLMVNRVQTASKHDGVC
jgi:hypothetical protein